MCDDYSDDDNSDSFDSENSSDEDTFDEGFDEDDEIVSDDNEGCEDSDNEDACVSESPDDEILPTFDMTDEIILGSMIAGNAYEEAVDIENRLKLLNSKSNK